MDWIRFLEENNIHFVSRGPNTKKGEVSVHCPMCGDEDPSEHLGISLSFERWGCHRDQSHRGKSSRTLIKALLGCSSHEAGAIVRQYNAADPDSLESALMVLEADNRGAVQHEDDLARQARLQMMGPQFKDFTAMKPRGVTKRFFKYLIDRGYDDPQKIIDDFDLKCALTGRYKDRIIIPVRLNGELLGWTSRVIGNPINAPRYLASSEDVKTTVLDYDHLKQGGRQLFIVEGPFDAIKLASAGHAATCTFGTSPTISQIALLRALCSKYKKPWVLFDKGADKPASDLASWIGAQQAHLPSNVDDPGELEAKDLKGMHERGFDGFIDTHAAWWNITWHNASNSGKNVRRKASNHKP